MAETRAGAGCESARGCGHDGPFAVLFGADEPRANRAGRGGGAVRARRARGGLWVFVRVRAAGTDLPRAVVGHPQMELARAHGSELAVIQGERAARLPRGLCATARRAAAPG